MLDRTLILVPTRSWQRTLRAALPSRPGLDVRTATDWIDDRVFEARLAGFVSGDARPGEDPPTGAESPRDGSHLPRVGLPPVEDAFRRAADFHATIREDPERWERFARPGWLDELAPVLSDLGGTAPIARGLAIDSLLDPVLPRKDDGRLGPGGGAAFRGLAHRYLVRRADHDRREVAARAIDRVATEALRRDHVARALAIGFYDLDVVQALALGTVLRHVGTERFSFVVPATAKGRALLEEFRPTLVSLAGVQDLEALVASEGALPDRLLGEGLRLAERIDPTPEATGEGVTTLRLSIHGALHPTQEVLLALDRTRALAEEEGVPPHEIVWITHDREALAGALDAACPGDPPVHVAGTRPLAEVGVGRILPRLRRMAAEPDEVGALLAVVLHPCVRPPRGGKRAIVRLLLAIRSHPFFQRSWRRLIREAADRPDDPSWRALREGPTVEVVAVDDGSSEGREEESRDEAPDRDSADAREAARATRWIDRMREASRTLLSWVDRLESLTSATRLDAFLDAFEALHAEHGGWLHAEEEACAADPVRAAAGGSWRRLRRRLREARDEDGDLVVADAAARFDLLERAALAEPVERPATPGAIRALDVLAARGERRRVVFVLGMHEGGFPHRPATPLLGRDDDRLRAERETRDSIDRFLLDPPPAPLLPKRRELEERILFREAVAVAGERLFLSYARQDASGESRVPSAFLSECVAAHLAATGGIDEDERVALTRTVLSGRPDWIAVLSREIHARRRAAPGDLPRLDVAEVDWVEATAEGPPPAVDVRMRARHAGKGRDAVRDRTAGRRRRSEPHRGAASMDVASLLRAHARPGGEGSFERHAWSPNALEDLLGCPHRHRLARELDLRDDDPLPAFEGLDPLGRGSILHAVYQEWITSLEGQEAPDRSDRWRKEARRVLGTALHRARAAMGGSSAYERFFLGRERWALARDVEAFAEHEWSWRRETNLARTWCEVPFGENDPIALDVGEGRPTMRLRLRGRIDRVDAFPGGDARVVEYKTGSKWSDEALRRTMRIQTWIYARVVATHPEIAGLAAVGGDGTAARSVRGQYLFASLRGEFAVREPRIDESALFRLLTAARDLYDAGLAPPLPRDRRLCDRCEVRAICLPGRLEALGSWSERILLAPDENGVDEGDDATRVVASFLRARRDYAEGRPEGAGG